MASNFPAMLFFSNVEGGADTDMKIPVAVATFRPYALVAQVTDGGCGRWEDQRVFRRPRGHSRSRDVCGDRRELSLRLCGRGRSPVQGPRGRAQLFDDRRVVCRCWDSGSDRRDERVWRNQTREWQLVDGSLEDRCHRSVPRSQGHCRSPDRHRPLPCHRAAGQHDHGRARRPVNSSRGTIDHLSWPV